MSLLPSSSARSLLALASVDHGGEKVDAAAAAELLLWALAADRYYVVQHYFLTVEESFMIVYEGGVLAPRQPTALGFLGCRVF